MTGDPVSGNNGLLYRYSDHLGSTSVLGKAGAGSPQSDSIARYFPFGDWRTEPAQTITSLGYTGHRHNNLAAANDLGLIYMNARYYLPGLGRFASPDTLVPDPANPQAFNRYSYVFNNPARLTDPTGHLTEEEVNEYFGYATRDDMLEAGWDEDLINWLWNPDITWGEVFTFELGEAMLVLFETHHIGSSRYEGGFYGLTSDILGQWIDFRSISWLNDDSTNAVRLEERYAEDWENLPVRLGSDGTPFYSPTKYVDALTWGTAGAFMTVAGTGVAAVACVVVAPCVVGFGTLGAALTTTSTGIAAASAVIFLGEWLNNNLTHSYPAIQNPDPSLINYGISRTHHHTRPPQGVYR